MNEAIVGGDGGIDRKLGDLQSTSDDILSMVAEIHSVYSRIKEEQATICEKKPLIYGAKYTRAGDEDATSDEGSEERVTNPRASQSTRRLRCGTFLMNVLCCECIDTS